MDRVFKVNLPVEVVERPGPEGGVALLDLAFDQCRYPIGDPGQDGFHFCGASRESVFDRRQYCRAHNQLSYVPAPAPIRRGGWR